ncbi:MAG: PEP/pyruvate-binding domain-containing protein, partial [Candidatus Heimdallarchaeota archaeon]
DREGLDALIKEAGLEKLIKTIILQPIEAKRNEISKDENQKLLTQIRNAIFDISLCDEIYEDIRFVLASLPTNSRLSVRSSGTLEDMQHYSFAGQYDTFLNLSSVEDIVESIKKCWASIWKENTLYYLDNLTVGSLIPEMAIIIQQQIPSKISGVLFTLNSQSGNENEMIIESIWGLGEGVVSGEITPDRYVVDLTSSSVLDRNIVEKQYKIVGKETKGISKVPTSNDEKSISTLDDDQLKQLVKVGIEIASLYGFPQDIEWAIYNGKIYILQTRPITTIQFDSNLGQWTNANFVEVFPGFHNPLSFSLTGKAFTDTLQEFFIQSKIWRNPLPKDQ